MICNDGVKREEGTASVGMEIFTYFRKGKRGKKDEQPLTSFDDTTPF